MNRSQRRARSIAANRDRLRRVESANSDSTSPRGLEKSGQEYSSIELRIDELVLQGFPSSQRAQIGEAVTQELSRLLIENGIPTAVSEASGAARIDRGSINIRNTVPATVGTQIASAIYGDGKQ